MKYAVQVISKYTGDTVWLGTKHETREAAKEFAEKEVCTRCNRFDLWLVEDDAVWINRHRGFSGGSLE